MFLRRVLCQLDGRSWCKYGTLVRLLLAHAVHASFPVLLFEVIMGITCSSTHCYNFWLEACSSVVAYCSAMQLFLCLFSVGVLALQAFGFCMRYFLRFNW